MTNSRTRSRGFDRPFSIDQIISWGIQPAAFVAFTWICAELLETERLVPVLCVNFFLIAIFAASWLYCELVDSADSTVPIRNFGIPVPEKPARYCNTCKKRSAGLDHHCTWLNTCIGANNYGAFFILAITATVQSLFATVISTLIVTSWSTDLLTQFESRGHAEILIWVFIASSLALTVAYGYLLAFHIYLLVIRMGTYCWILKKKGSSTSVVSTKRDNSSEIPTNNSIKREEDSWKSEWLKQCEAREMGATKPPMPASADTTPSFSVTSSPVAHSPKKFLDDSSSQELAIEIAVGESEPVT